MTTEFGNFEFTLGSVRGLRSWHADFGGLRSVSRSYVWQPGENVAHCLRMQLCDCPTCRAERDAVQAVSPHRIDTCDCGFYAYFAPQIDVGTETYTRPSGVYSTGVIEAYGRTIIGTKGFRAERARVLAVAINGQPSPDSSSWQAIAYEHRRTNTALACHRLGVPLFETVEQLLAEFPTSSAEEFRQEAAS